MKRFRQFLPYALVGVLALGAGIWVAQSRYQPKSDTNRVPEALWKLSFPSLSGTVQTLEDWRGKTLVVNFWATWCAPCREEIPDLIAIRREYATKSVEIVGIAIDNSAAVTPYAREMGIVYPILMGEGSALEMSRALGNPSGALPYTVVIAADGTIVARHLGRLSKAKLQAILQNSATASGRQ